MSRTALSNVAIGASSYDDPPSLSDACQVQID
jgi:hypothetical protein